jgi:hypothetical protein
MGSAPAPAILLKDTNQVGRIGRIDSKPGLDLGILVIRPTDVGLLAPRWEWAGA